MLASDLSCCSYTFLFKPCMQVATRWPKGCPTAPWFLETAFVCDIDVCACMYVHMCHEHLLKETNISHLLHKNYCFKA